jgi:AcrR family transcriptional regulator
MKTGAAEKLAPPLDKSFRSKSEQLRIVAVARRPARPATDTKAAPRVRTTFILSLLTRKYIHSSVTDMKTTKRRYVMTARAAKADATKARIRASAVQLYRERAIEDFTLEEVAQLAGTTVQTVLRAFGSKDELIYAALEELAASGVGIRPTPPGDVAAAVRAVYDIYEGMGDLVIQRLNDEIRRPALKPGLDQGRANHRDVVKTLFAPQLARQSGGARAQLLNILLVATDVYVWKLLRRDRALSRAAAEAIVCRMIDGVTNEEKAHGTHLMAELVGRRESAS